jgi:hypothetical protein
MLAKQQLKHGGREEEASSQFFVLLLGALEKREMRGKKE